ncbi:MAG: heparinase II/III family protein [Pseudomonadota bacterium]
MSEMLKSDSTGFSANLHRKAARKIVTNPLWPGNWTKSALDLGRFGWSPPPILFANGSPERAKEIYAGRFDLAGSSVETGEHSPFTLPPPSVEWQRALHSFTWLDDLTAGNHDLARANARALVGEWIEFYGTKSEGDAFEPALMAKRILAWLRNGALLSPSPGSGADPLITRHLERQINLLRTITPYLGNLLHRLKAHSALATSVVCFDCPDKPRQQILNALDEETQEQFQPDGSHISRNPQVLFQALIDLLPLRAMLSKTGYAGAEKLAGRIDRMMGHLRLMRHRGGEIARFNGAGTINSALLDAVLEHDTTTGNYSLSSAHAGFERLREGQTEILIDAGSPVCRPGLPQPFAGSLAIEICIGKQPFVVNCGTGPQDRPELGQMLRSSAAHSTATIDDHSSIVWSGRGGKNGTNQRPSRPLVTRSRHSPFHLTARHDGYVDRFGYELVRELQLTDDGRTIQGSDRFLSTAESNETSHLVLIRFHLHPDVEADWQPGQPKVQLSSPSHHAWTFICIDGAVEVEPSMYFADVSGPKTTNQIVVRAAVNESAEIRWVFQQS